MFPSLVSTTLTFSKILRPVRIMFTKVISYLIYSLNKPNTAIRTVKLIMVIFSSELIGLVIKAVRVVWLIGLLGFIKVTLYAMLQVLMHPTLAESLIGRLILGL